MGWLRRSSADNRCTLSIFAFGVGMEMLLVATEHPICSQSSSFCTSRLVISSCLLHTALLQVDHAAIVRNLKVPRLAVKNGRLDRDLSLSPPWASCDDPHRRAVTVRKAGAGTLRRRATACARSPRAERRERPPRPFSRRYAGHHQHFYARRLQRVVRSEGLSAIDLENIQPGNFAASTSTF